MNSPDYSLTPEQQKAFTQLVRAINKCQKTGIYLWDNYGTIEAVNGDVVVHVAPDQSGDVPYDRMQGMTVDDKGCWHGSNADDPLYVFYK